MNNRLTQGVEFRQNDVKTTVSSFGIRIGIAWMMVLSPQIANGQTTPKPPGRLVDLGGHRLHVNCTGGGHPTVVVENGLGDFSFDWILVQTRVSKFARICTYDRGGYAWSDPGPLPRTFPQLNLELHDALTKLGEQGPFVLVGHSFGGPVVRSFASSYSKDTAGMVLVDAAHEEQRYTYKGKAILIRESASGRAIPEPHEKMRDSDIVDVTRPNKPRGALMPLYQLLPAPQQELQVWAESLAAFGPAEDSQRDWSPESLLSMHNSRQAGSLGAVPLIVLTRAKGGFDSDLDIPAPQLEKERTEAQRRLTLLSTNSAQIIVSSGHNMEIEAPEEVTAAILRVCAAVRKGSRV
jgi:pimeloyl-ACP methyl ester carboxylesterase